jgi:hypothetical protein
MTCKIEDVFFYAAMLQIDRLMLLNSHCAKRKPLISEDSSYNNFTLGNHRDNLHISPVPSFKSLNDKMKGFDHRIGCDFCFPLHSKSIFFPNLYLQIVDV